MKLVTKLQSVSDIITNSSSEVFLVGRNPSKDLLGMDSGCIAIIAIDKEWLGYNWDGEKNLICSIPGLEKYYDLSEEEWSELYDVLLDKVIELANGYYYVEIEDHYSFDLFDADVEEMKEEALYYESRH